MNYISTRGATAPVGFREATLMGLAPDGGLLVPEQIPDVRDALDRWKTLSYRDLAVEIMMRFADLGEPALRRLVHESYDTFESPEVTPLRPLGEFYVLELFHGPTLAFKDVALQFLGRLFEQVLAERGERLNIVGATSGDTGSAAIHGVRGRKGIRIFMMHPRGRVSPTQERQMTTVLDDNVFNMAVEGTFDDCQRIMKTLFRDLEFKASRHLGSVNSINWARLLAQIVYYFYGGFRAMERAGADEVSFSVPTGNFGDVFAGYLARRMGLPVRQLILATNENDILARAFTSGDYRLGPVSATVSPSMDIQVASNFERYLYYLAGEKGATVRGWMDEFERQGALRLPLGGKGGVDATLTAGAGSTQGTLETIRRWHRDAGYVLDPHTAVGVDVGGRLWDRHAPLVCLATAHPAKFGETIRTAIGQSAHHPVLERLDGLPARAKVLPASAADVKAWIIGNVND